MSGQTPAPLFERTPVALPGGAYRANLYVYDPFGRVDWYALPPSSFVGDRYFTIGRGTDCDIALQDGSVSSHHAVLALEKGALKGTQTRDVTIPAADGKPEQKAHAAVHGLEIPTKDSVVEVRIRFEGATMIDVEFDDRKYTGAHYGHLCRAQVRLNGVTIIDERDGGMKNEIREMRNDPAKKAEVAALLKGRQVTYPAKLQAGKWYTLVVETVGDEMRVTLDGKPAGYLKSSGIAHATKSKIELGVAGKDGYFDDIKVWNAVPIGRP